MRASFEEYVFRFFCYPRMTLIRSSLCAMVV